MMTVVPIGLNVTPALVLAWGCAVLPDDEDEPEDVGLAFAVDAGDVDVDVDVDVADVEFDDDVP